MESDQMEIELETKDAKIPIKPKKVPAKKAIAKAVDGDSLPAPKKKRRTKTEIQAEEIEKKLVSK